MDRLRSEQIQEWIDLGVDRLRSEGERGGGEEEPAMARKNKNPTLRMGGITYMLWLQTLKQSA